MPLNEPLLDRTRRLLRNCDLKHREIASRAGVGLPWLKRFSSKTESDASVKMVQKLHDFLDLYERAQANSTAVAPDTRAPAA